MVQPDWCGAAPEELIVCLILLNIIINNPDNAVECTLNKLVADTKLGGER